MMDEATRKQIIFVLEDKELTMRKVVVSIVKVILSNLIYAKWGERT